jgi:hypothetical protein
MVTTEGSLRFVPSRVEGLPAVTEIAVFPDRLEVLSAGQWVVFHFADIARWPRPKSLRRYLCRIGWRPSWLPVGERDWFHWPAERFFRFYTTPPLVICMPVDEPQDYGKSYFSRLQEVIRSGGFHTGDLG